jgi:hypothetical protein
MHNQINFNNLYDTIHSVYGPVGFMGHHASIINDSSYPVYSILSQEIWYHSPSLIAVSFPAERVDVSRVAR